MGTFIFVLAVILLILGLGMLRERRREKKVREWVVRHGGTFHWPFIQADHPSLPATELARCFEIRGARLWATAIGHAIDDRPVWLIEYESTPAGHGTGRWHCLVAEACQSAAAAERICQERNTMSRAAWVARESWIATRRPGLISSAMLDELATRLR